MSEKNRKSLLLCDCRNKDELYRVTNYPDDMTDEDMEAGLPYGYRTTWTCLRPEHYFDALNWVQFGNKYLDYFVYSPKHELAGFGFTTGEN